MKIDDGGSRASAPALIHVLRQIDGLTTAHLRDLAFHASPPVLGGGKPVGSLETVFDLRRGTKEGRRKSGKGPASATRPRA